MRVFLFIFLLCVCLYASHSFSRHLLLLLHTFPLLPLPPSWSSHCQSTPRTTRPPVNMPRAVIFLDLRRDSNRTLGGKESHKDSFIEAQEEYKRVFPLPPPHPRPTYDFVKTQRTTTDSTLGLPGVDAIVPTIRCTTQNNDIIPHVCNPWFARDYTTRRRIDVNRRRDLKYNIKINVKSKE